MSSRTDPDTAALTVELITSPSFQLRDGRITADREQALAELRQARTQSSELVRAVAAALLRLPELPSRTRPTPSRAAFVDRLVEEGLLLSAVARPYITTGVVPDTAWDQVRRLIGLLELHYLEEEVWRIDVSTGAGGQRLIAGDELPAAIALDALNAMLADGWQVVGVERLLDEDRFAGDADDVREVDAAVSSRGELELLAEDSPAFRHLRGLRYHLVRGE
jgi:hypothetical protein